MKNVFVYFFFLISLPAQAQYYFNDIAGTLEISRQMQTYRAGKVKTVSAAGYDKQGVKENSFSEFQEVKENGMALRSSAISNLNKTVVYNRFDNQGKIISTIDSSSALQSSISYEYDDAGKITRILNNVKDPANDFNQTEAHHWIYNSAGKPEKMWRIISSGATADSLEIRFVTDENGNIAEERTFRKGLETGYLYYYYDDKNRITDVVRYNVKLKKLLPDFMFEYDDNDRVIQKITPTSNRLMGYLIWRYIFDERGLKTKEALFNDDKQLTGRIEYSYTYSQ